MDLSTVTRPEWHAYAAWVISTVVFRRFLDREADETTFVPLASEYVDLHIPARIRRRLLDDLLSAGVLESDHLYYFGRYANGGRGKCLCYRLGSAYRGVRVSPRPIYHLELLRKLATAWDKERNAIVDPPHLTLRTWHDRVEVLPDAPYGEHPLLDRMIEGERRFSVCAQGRIHTNVANLPCQYRQYIRLAGRELVSVDISTSQPLLLAILLRMGRIPREAAQGGEHQAIFHPYSDFSLSVYLEDCLDGSVYDRIAAKTGYTRDEVKPLFLAVIYGQPEHMETKVGMAFRQLYPGVYAAVVDLNFRLGHGGLPRLMQRLESGVMIGRVASRLVRENPLLPLLTVHDSVLVPAEHAEYIRHVIEAEWVSEFGVFPRTKCSGFTDSQPARQHKRPRGRKIHLLRKGRATNFGLRRA